ncbi:MAG: penicillin acylase family protein [Acidimicrobiia bacterium]|nr:penicillin acylase family protein [Acidimicrobiia bacterium]
MIREKSRWGLPAFCAVLSALILTTSSAHADGPATLGPVQDTASHAWTVLPPGNGDATGWTSRYKADQVAMYDRIDDRVADGTLAETDLPRYFKDARLGIDPEDVVRRAEPRPGVEIRWDRFAVPHVFGDTSEDVAFGAGWVTTEQRFLVAEGLRAIGRSGTLELAGGGLGDILGSLGGDGIHYTDAELDAQVDRACAAEPARCPEVLALVDAYVEGVNRHLEAKPPIPAAITRLLGIRWPKWKRSDVIAAAMAMGTIFGEGGGGELGNAHAIRVLQSRFGAEAEAAWRELRRPDDPAARTHVAGTFPYPLYGDGSTSPVGPTANSTDWAAVALPDDGLAGTPPPGDDWWTDLPDRGSHSNYLAVAGEATADGHPVLAGGPQMGYTHPSYLLEMELQGGGYRVSGLTVPGMALFVLIGHTDEYAWSITSGGSDLIDLRAELLCEPDGSAASLASTHYVFDGVCTAMERVGERNVVPRTVHGPVVERVTVDGKPVAISQQRASRGYEAFASLPFMQLNFGEVPSAAGFAETLRHVPFSLNWVYVDARDIAYTHTGRYPLRAPGTNAELPVWGTGEWEWTGTLDWTQQPHEVDPAKGYISSWNNKPAPGWQSPAWGQSVYQRVELLDRRLARQRARRPAGLSVVDVVTIVQDAATADLRAEVLLPEVLGVLGDSPAPSAEADDTRRILATWVAAGGNRRDRDANLLADSPATPIIDVFGDLLADATLARLAGGGELPTPGENPPNMQGSAFGSGPLSYSTVDLQKVRAGTGGVCGNGDLEKCRDEIWALLDRAARQVAADQMPFLAPYPDLWTKWVFAERIRFIPLMWEPSMRWQNRASFQQVMSFG